MTPGADRGIVSRPLDGDDDWRRLRSVLSELGSLTPPGFAWNVRRLDGRRFYRVEPPDSFALQAPVQLWEDAGGRLVAAVNDESPGEAHIQVHPAFRFLEVEIVEWAEEHLAAPATDGAGRTLALAVLEEDELRRQLLRARGYEESAEWSMTYRLRFPLLNVPPFLPDGYVLRTTRPDDPDDRRRIAELLNAAFARTSHTPGEYEAFVRHAPSFCADLDLVAVTSDGICASYVGISYDDESRRGVVEPVCTSPAHRGLGLALTLLQEGLRRLELRRAADVVVETGSQAAANALYPRAGFSESRKATTWRKTGL